MGMGNAGVIVVITTAFLVLSILLSCQERSPTLETGVAAPPPQGAVAFCNRYPEDERCALN